MQQEVMLFQWQPVRLLAKIIYLSPTFLCLCASDSYIFFPALEKWIWTL